MLKKQVVFIAVGLFIVFVMLGVYFFAPIGDKKNGSSPSDETTAPDEISKGENGEYIHPNGRIFIFEPQDRSNVESVTVKNSLGEYTLVRAEDEEDAFYVEGHPSLTLSEEAVSDIIVYARYPLSTQSLENPGELSAYGLGEDAKEVTLKTLDRKTFSFLIGSKLPTGTGYYVAVPGRDQVYLFDDNYSVFENSENSLFSLSLTPSISDASLIDNMTLKKSGALFVSIRAMTQAELDKDLSVNRYTMDFPAGTIPSSENISKIFDCLTTMAVDSVLVTAPESAELEQYKLSQNSDYYFSYTYKSELYEYYASAPVDGFYTVYSPQFGVIAKVSTEYFYFLDWTRKDYASARIFEINIDEVSKVEITGASATRASFELSYSPSGELSVTDSVSGEVYAEDFRQLYMDMLRVNIEDYSDVSALPAEYASFVITLIDKTVYEYRFYAITSRTCLYTCNGVLSGYYVAKDAVETVLDDVLALQSR